MINMNVGLRVGRLRAIFRIRQNVIHRTFPAGVPPPGHLAYVEWYSLSQNPGAHHKLYSVSKISDPKARQASVIELKDVRRTCQLWPKFGAKANRQWTSENVLDKCDKFFLGNRSDTHVFQTLY
jgi:hypothetical protein